MSANTLSTKKIALIGFGEAANAFVFGWALDDPDRIVGYDAKIVDPTTSAEMTARFERAGVAGSNAPHAALMDATFVFSEVTEEQAFAAAQTGAVGVQKGAFWFDCNSCAPDINRYESEVVEAASGRYVDVAVMVPVHPKLHHVPL